MTPCWGSSASCFPQAARWLQTVLHIVENYGVTSAEVDLLCGCVSHKSAKVPSCPLTLCGSIGLCKPFMLLVNGMASFGKRRVDQQHGQYT